MSNQEDGGSAFPRQNEADGMTLRDYFAAASLTGDLSALQIDGRRFRLLVELAKAEAITIALAIAREAYEQADAMLEARKQ